jgi:hypothetical protein
LYLFILVGARPDGNWNPEIHPLGARIVVHRGAPQPVRDGPWQSPGDAGAGGASQRRTAGAGAPRAGAGAGCSPPERAALALTDPVTRLTGGAGAERIWDELRDQLTDEEIASLLRLIGAINLWTG